MDTQGRNLRFMLNGIGQKLLEKEVEQLAFLYIKDSRNIKTWLQLMSELLAHDCVTSSEEDLSLLMKNLKAIRRESLTQIVLDYQSGLTASSANVGMEEGEGHTPESVILGSNVMANVTEFKSLKRPRKATSEELLLEENLSCKSLVLCHSTFDEDDKDMDDYDEKNALNEEQKLLHKRFVEHADECAKKSPDPQTQVGTVIVSDQGEIIGEGCNRMPRGCEGKLPWSENKAGEPLENGKHPYVVYAIVVAILEAIRKGAYEKLQGATVYATLYPSNTCAQLIREVGISSVVYTTTKFSNTKFRKAARLILEPDVECKYYSKV